MHITYYVGTFQQADTDCKSIKLSPLIFIGFLTPKMEQDKQI